MRYVILGGSIAGLTAAKTIRSLDKQGEIVIVSAENSPAYYRPLIPFLVQDAKKESDLFLTEDVLKEVKADFSNRTAERIDRSAKTVFLSGRKKLAYDRLLIATGASPLIPNIPGINSPSVHVLRTMTDALRLKESVKRAKQAVVIGGGMVGIKAAAALRHCPFPISVTIVEMGKHILPLRLDQRGAAIVTPHLEQEGISVLTGTTVKVVITKGDMVEAIKLANGRMLPADVVIIGAGARPNVAFLKGSGIAVRKGVVVDKMLRTNLPDIYAAGDVAETRDIVTGRSFASGLWTNAVEMGRLAGMNMAGSSASCEGYLPVMNATEVANIPIISAGMIEPGRGYQATVTDTDGGYRKVVMKDGLVAGICFVGDVTNAGVYVNMIKNRVPVRNGKDKMQRGTATYADIAAPA
jgi:NAD(P)H-nitrite reductase large subunit